jgi:hypothetical protein
VELKIVSAKPFFKGLPIDLYITGFYGNNVLKGVKFGLEAPDFTITKLKEERYIMFPNRVGKLEITAEEAQSGVKGSITMEVEEGAISLSKLIEQLKMLEKQEGLQASLEVLENILKQSSNTIKLKTCSPKDMDQLIQYVEKWQFPSPQENDRKDAVIEKVDELKQQSSIEIIEIEYGGRKIPRGNDRLSPFGNQRLALSMLWTKDIFILQWQAGKVSQIDLLEIGKILKLSHFSQNTAWFFITEEVKETDLDELKEFLSQPWPELQRQVYGLKKFSGEVTLWYLYEINPEHTNSRLLYKIPIKR